MRYAVISYDNVGGRADLALFRTQKEAMRTMREYFDSDLRVEILRAGAKDVPKREIDYAKYTDFCKVCVTKDRIEAQIFDTEDEFTYQVIELSEKDLVEAGLAEI